MADCHWRLSHRAALKFLDAIASLRLVFVRMVLGSLPDRMSGYRIAMWSL
jgi:hypothetical protein